MSKLALHLLVSQLLASNTAQVAVIDTTGNFDVLRLYQIIIYHIKSKQNAERAAATSNVNPKLFYDDTPVAKLYALASQMLDRVKVMRVFDFVGVSEAIGELREGVRVAAKDQEMATAWAAEPTQKTHVADSQADEDDEDIMLFDGAGDVEASSSETPKLDSVSLIIIDNLTSVINPIIKSNYVQGKSVDFVSISNLLTLDRPSNLDLLHALFSKLRSGCRCGCLGPEQRSIIKIRKCFVPRASEAESRCRRSCQYFHQRSTWTARLYHSRSRFDFCIYYGATFLGQIFWQSGRLSSVD